MALSIWCVTSRRDIGRIMSGKGCAVTAFTRPHGRGILLRRFIILERRFILSALLGSPFGSGPVVACGFRACQCGIRRSGRERRPGRHSFMICRRIQSAARPIDVVFHQWTGLGLFGARTISAEPREHRLSAAPPLEMKAIADGDAAQGIKGFDPVLTGRPAHP